MSLSTVKNEAGIPARQRARLPARPRTRVLPLLFVGPALLITVVFTLYPLVQAFQLTFMKWDLLSPKKYVGGANYADLLRDSGFRADVEHTVIYTVLTLIGTYLLALGAALLLNSQLPGLRLVRVAAGMPVVLPMVVAGLIWKWLYEPQTGLLTLTAEILTGISPNWLYSPATALPSLVVVGIWKEFGLYMLVFLIGLQSINPASWRLLSSMAPPAGGTSGTSRSRN